MGANGVSGSNGEEWFLCAGDYIFFNIFCLKCLLHIHRETEQCFSLLNIINWGEYLKSWEHWQLPENKHFMLCENVTEDASISGTDLPLFSISCKGGAEPTSGIPSHWKDAPVLLFSKVYKQTELITHITYKVASLKCARCCQQHYSTSKARAKFLKCFLWCLEMKCLYFELVKTFALALRYGYCSSMLLYCTV